MKKFMPVVSSLLILSLFFVLALPVWAKESKGQKLYSDYYQKNNGTVEVYYDGIDENGNLVGGKVTQPLEPVDAVERLGAAPPSWNYETMSQSSHKSENLALQPDLL